MICQINFPEDKTIYFFLNLKNCIDSLCQETLILAFYLVYNPLRCLFYQGCITHSFKDQFMLYRVLIQSTKKQVYELM